MPLDSQSSACSLPNMYDQDCSFFLEGHIFLSRSSLNFKFSVMFFTRSLPFSWLLKHTKLSYIEFLWSHRITYMSTLWPSLWYFVCKLILSLYCQNPWGVIPIQPTVIHSPSLCLELQFSYFRSTRINERVKWNRLLGLIPKRFWFSWSGRANKFAFLHSNSAEYAGVWGIIVSKALLYSKTLGFKS